MKKSFFHSFFLKENCEIFRIILVENYKRNFNNYPEQFWLQLNGVNLSRTSDYTIRITTAITCRSKSLEIRQEHFNILKIFCCRTKNVFTKMVIIYIADLNWKRKCFRAPKKMELNTDMVWTFSRKGQWQILFLRSW